MKAIQVKYLSATNTKPARLKVFAEGLQGLIYSISKFDSNSFKSVEQQAAEEFANHFNWLEYNSYTECEKVLRGGQLANGDHVFVIVAIPFEVRKSFIEFKDNIDL
jgi:hypothetical protein